MIFERVFSSKAWGLKNLKASSGAFFQDSGDFPEGAPVGEREREGVAPFDDVPEKPEPVAENVCQLVEHQAASSRVSRQRS